MDDAVIQAIRQILELGWPAISLIQTWIMWRALRECTAEYIAHLSDKPHCPEPHGQPEDVAAESLHI